MRKHLLLIVMAVGLLSCQKESKVDSSKAAKLSAGGLKVEEAFPGQSGIIATGKYHGQELSYMLINGKKVFEGDILLTTDVSSGVVTNSTGRSNSAYYWPGNIVYYTIDPSMANPSRATDAINYWLNNTSLRFVLRTTEPDYITFVSNAGGCYITAVGKNSGQQFINLDPGCTTGNAIHEIGHAVGLWHEQSRVDRDTYITINTGNIASGYANNFQTYVQQGQDGFDSPNGLDFTSIMMYPSDAFSFNGLPTITKKNGTTFTVQRSYLSANDKLSVSFMYTSINGRGSFDFIVPPGTGTGVANGSGTITGPVGKIISVTISAYGASGASHITNFTLSGANFTDSPQGNNVHVYNGSTTLHFVMPAGGSVTWTGGFSETDRTGIANIGVG